MPFNAGANVQYYWVREPAKDEADYEPFTAEFGIPQESSLGTKKSSFFPILLDDIRVLNIIAEAYVKSGCPAYGIWVESVKNPLIDGELITIEGLLQITELQLPIHTLLVFQMIKLEYQVP